MAASFASFLHWHSCWNALPISVHKPMACSPIQSRVHTNTMSAMAAMVRRGVRGSCITAVAGCIPAMHGLYTVIGALHDLPFSFALLQSVHLLPSSDHPVNQIRWSCCTFRDQCGFRVYCMRGGVLSMEGVCTRTTLCHCSGDRAFARFRTYSVTVGSGVGVCVSLARRPRTKVSTAPLNVVPHGMGENRFRLVAK